MGDVMGLLRYSHEVGISIDNYHMDTIVWSDNGLAARIVIMKANIKHECEEGLMTSDIFSFTNMIDLIKDIKRAVSNINKIRVFGKSEKDKEFIRKALSL